MPWNMGSPLASTAIRRPAWAAISPGTAGRSGDGQATRSAVTSGGSSSSWRGPPTTTAAPVSASRDAAVSPAQPSAPIPTTATGADASSSITVTSGVGGNGRAQQPHFT